MRTIVHLSDLHFGRIDEATLEPLLAFVRDLSPDLIAISGDLTQRARSAQFQRARAFLEALPKPQLVVPGNHDIPARNLLARFFWPLRNYHRYITSELQPFYADDELAVIGINTARSLVIKGGRISEEQIAQVAERMQRFKDEVTKIVVTHHPFDVPAGHEKSDLVGHARLAMETLSTCGVDMFLSGHLHLSHATPSALHYRIHGHSAVIIQAGTATSTRRRGETNSFNVIRIHHPQASVERMEWQSERRVFAAAGIEQFHHTENGWLEISGTP